MNAKQFPARISRRRFLQLTGAGLAATSLLAGCTSAPPPAPTTAPAKPAAPAPTAVPAKPAEPTKPAAAATKPAAAPTTAAAPATKPTGRLTIAQGLDPRTLLPLDSTTAQEHNVSGQIVEKLMMYGVDAKIQPFLATDWKFTSDTTLQIRLRPNVKFTNGEPFDAEAAKFSLDLMLKATAYSRFSEDIERVEIADPMTINVVAKRKSAVVLPAVTRAGWMVAPKYYAQVGANGFGQKPVGTGPFKLVEWVKDSQVVMEANTAYWGGSPLVERLVFKPIPEPSSRLAALEAGDIDMTIDVSLPDVDRLERNSNLSVQLVEGMRLMRVVLDSIHPGPVQDKRVRQALNYAVDVPALIQALFKGRASKLEAQMASPVYAGYSPATKAYPFDQAKAKALLAEAGYPNGLDLDFYTPTGRYAQDKEVSEALVQQFAKVGVRCKLIVMESGQFGTQFNALKIGPLAFHGTLTVPELYYQLNQDLTGATYAYYSNKQYDELLRQAAGTLSDPDRMALYAKVIEVAREDPPHVWLYVAKDAYAAHKKVRGFQARPDQWLDLVKVSVS